MWPQKANTNTKAAAAAAAEAAAAHRRRQEAESAYPPGMQIDIALKDMDKKEKGASGGEAVGGRRNMAEGRRGVKCVIKI